MLRQEAGIAPAGTDVHQVEGTRRNGGEAKGGSENLATALAMRAVEGENVHAILYFLTGWRSGRYRLRHVPNLGLEQRHDGAYRG